MIEQARRNHPFLRGPGEQLVSSSFAGAECFAAPFDDPLPPISSEASELHFKEAELGEVRRLVRAHASAAGLSPGRIADLVLAVSEIATNSLLHGGGAGTLWVWRAGDTIICEVRDEGRIEDPLVGRRRPSPSALGGRGLWLANQLCELVQVRAFASHGVVRLHMWIADPAPVSPEGPANRP